MHNVLKVLEVVDPTSYDPIDQGIVVLREGEENPEVDAFYAFMLSKSVQRVLRRYGHRFL
jgi:molybdate transport system substrate-binding protein